MKRTALVRRTPLVNRTPLVAHSTLRRTGHIAPVSGRRAKENRIYSALRIDFLAARPCCEFPGGCGRAADTVQHLRGRRGARLNDTTQWAASCLAHNLWAEDNTGEALAMGWLIRIEGAA